jgi:hypothetical protein
MAAPPSAGRLSQESLAGLSEPERQAKIVQALNELRDSSIGALNQGLTPANSDVQIFEMSVDVPTDWVTATLLNSWAADTVSRYRKTPEGLVEIQGTISGGTGFPTLLFTLPAAYRPENDTQFAVNSSSAFGYLDVAASGEVAAVVGDVAGFSMQSTFSALDPTPIVPTCWPKTIQCTVKGDIVGVKVFKIVDREDSSKTVLCGEPTWDTVGSASGQKTLRIKSLPGLCALRKYKITFIAYGG